MGLPLWNWPKPGSFRRVLILAGSYSTPAMWSPFTPTCLPTWSDREGRLVLERISSGGLPMAPADRIRTLHSISSLWPGLGWRGRVLPPFFITDAVAKYRQLPAALLPRLD